MSGHNRWSKVKHKKGPADAARGKIFGKITKEIVLSVREGSSDPASNARLKRAMDAARAANMPQDNVERAIKKGTGELEGVTYEELMYEGVGPAGTLLLAKVTTDNRNRTAAEIRKLFDVRGGALGAAGSAAWAFEEKGVIALPADAATEEQLFELAVGAGAEDITNDGDEWTITTPRETLDAVRDTLEAAKLPVSRAELLFLAKNTKEVGADDATKLLALVEALEDHDDVQKVFADFEVPDDVLAALENA
ncbi:MAG: YebC/PmpR family DNA-binding transcriptional regulator [Myxococcales bacterium]|nr:YebC/PmpR family DNA-binding transcriptional regulator [Myxococcales bacterium]